MAMRGQRFDIDLDEAPDDARHATHSGATQTAGFNLDLVGDIRERIISSDPNPPAPPTLKGFETGFPAHRIRTGPSKFKSRRENQTAGRRDSKHPGSGPNRFSASPSQPRKSNDNVSDDAAIDQENKQRLAEMSDQEIEEARQELMAGLSPSLIEKLLEKANIDEGRADSSAELKPTLEEKSPQAKQSTRKVTFEEPEYSPSTASHAENKLLLSDPDGPPLYPPLDLQPASTFYPTSLPQAPNIHFPNPPKAPDLDPSDPDFLSALHSTYFPNLRADPSTMAWMTPIDAKAEEESLYSPSQESLPVSALRFDFRGRVLPPRLSAQISSTKGLHHHAHAPASAGYTVPELAHLARSSYPAQRCIAYQTLGRILYRLGRGDFGREVEDLCEGLWQLMEGGRVVDQLVEAAAKGDVGNRSIWAIATEAVWLWRKGGGRRWKGR